MATSKRSDGKRRVLVVDDHPIVRQGLKALIDAQPDLRVCGEAGSSAEATSLLSAARPDLAVIDLSLGSDDGLDLCRQMRLRHPAVHVLVLTVHDESLYAERALRAGARGYVMKHEAPEELVDAIRRVLAGDVRLSPLMAKRLVSHLTQRGRPASLCALDRLSDRELQVFRLIGEGRCVRDIARALFLSPKTVEAHREHIKQKLSMRSSAELNRYAIHMEMEHA